MSDILRIGLLYVLFFVAAGAQETPLPPPEAPFTRLPDRTAWEVDVSSSQNPRTPQQQNTAAGSQVIRIESVKTGDLKRDVLVYSDGKQMEVWYREKYRIAASSDKKNATVIDPATEERPDQVTDLLFSAGFPAISWISRNDYQNTARLGAALCYFYERKGAQPALQAWIDVHTGLPVAVQAGPEKYDFKFKSIPDSENLELPSPYAEAWSRFELLEAQRRAVESSAH